MLSAAAGAEQERIRDAAVRLSEAADELFFALPAAERRKLEKMEDRRKPGRMGEFYRQAEPLNREADALLDRIQTTKPITLAGAIALLGCIVYEDETVNLVIEFLRAYERGDSDA